MAKRPEIEYRAIYTNYCSDAGTDDVCQLAANAAGANFAAGRVAVG